MENKIFLANTASLAVEYKPSENASAALAYEAQEMPQGRRSCRASCPGALKTGNANDLKPKRPQQKSCITLTSPFFYDFGIDDDHLVYVTEDFEGTLARVG